MLKSTFYFLRKFCLAIKMAIMEITHTFPIILMDINRLLPQQEARSGNINTMKISLPEKYNDYESMYAQKYKRALHSK